MTTLAPPADWAPPAPKPQEGPLGALALLRALRTNPLTTWTRAHYELPILQGRSILGPTAVVNEPAAVRRVLLDNVAITARTTCNCAFSRPVSGAAC
jgi:hypothetical protein